MNEDSKIGGVAWKHRTYARYEEREPMLTEYNAFVARPDAVLRIIRKGGVVEAEIPLLAIPNCGFWEEHFYVFPTLLRVGDIEKWEAPEEALLRLTVQGEGFYWLAQKR
jgi:hypothetical protein